MKIVIVIPAYRPQIRPNEKASLLQLQDVLPDYPKVIIGPETMDYSAYLDLVEAKVEKFPDNSFKSRDTYSQLLLSSTFYEIFSDYEWMLIYQTDAWIFEDRLAEFTSQPYDYWGAPHTLNCHPRTELIDYRSGCIVGNGGFSLRRISAMKEACEKLGYPECRDIWAEDRAFTEGKGLMYVKVPPISEAFKFSIQDFYWSAMIFTDGQLPMGAHQADRWWPYDAYYDAIELRRRELMSRPPITRP